MSICFDVLRDPLLVVKRNDGMAVAGHIGPALRPRYAKAGSWISRPLIVLHHAPTVGATIIYKKFVDVVDFCQLSVLCIWVCAPANLVLLSYGGIRGRLQVSFPSQVPRPPASQPVDDLAAFRTCGSRGVALVSVQVMGWSLWSSAQEGLVCQ